MYNHILIATDGSELAGKAVAAGFDLARSLGAKVTAVTVTAPWTAILTGEAALGFPLDDYEKSVNETASHILTGVSTLARKADVNCATVHVKDQYPSEGILEAAKKGGCDLIVMASHGRRGWEGCCWAARRSRSLPTARFRCSSADRWTPLVHLPVTSPSGD